MTRHTIEARSDFEAPRVVTRFLGVFDADIIELRIHDMTEELLKST